MNDSSHKTKYFKQTKKIFSQKADIIKENKRKGMKAHMKKTEEGTNS